jgi:hypothetical protein
MTTLRRSYNVCKIPTTETNATTRPAALLLSCHHELVGVIGHQRSELAENGTPMHIQGAEAFPRGGDGR